MIIVEELKVNGTRVTLLHGSHGDYFISTANPTKFTLSRELSHEEAVKEFHEKIFTISRGLEQTKGGVVA